MKKEEPILVAIQCFVYNHEPYLRECLDGFIMQKTNFRYVAIVHDDCSIDDSAAIIREYEKKYPEIIKPIYETENLYSKHDGSLTRIADEATFKTGAKYVAKCEGDDYWIDPLKLQKQVDFLEGHPEVGLCYTDYDQRYGLSERIIPSMFEQQHHYRPETYEQHLLRPGYLAPMTWLCRTKLHERLTQSMVYTDGTYSHMLEAMKNSKVAYIPEVTAIYRAHQGSASSPVGSANLFRYVHGVFETQKHFVNMYPCSDELRNKVLMRGYLNVLPIAVMADKVEFIEEARAYMESQDLDISLIIRELKQGEMRRRSKAYRLGKALLKPFKRFMK